MASSAVFLDANVLIYALDKTSEFHVSVVDTIQRLLTETTTLCTSHHVIEEVLHVVQKIPEAEIALPLVVEQLNSIPDLILIEPAANIDFAQRYAALSQKLNMGVNDALILQIVLDAGITRIYSYDKGLLKQAITLGIEPIT